MPYSEGQIETIRAVQGLSQTPAGQTLLKFLRHFCYGTSRTFVVGDAYLSAFNEGMRSVYLELMRLKEVDETVLHENNRNPTDFEEAQ